MSSKWMMMTAAVLASAVTASAAIMTSDTFTGTALSAQWTAHPGAGASAVTVAGGIVSTFASDNGGWNGTSVASATGYTLPVGNFSVQIDESKGTCGGWWQFCYINVGIGADSYQVGKQWQGANDGWVFTGNNPYAGIVNMNDTDMQFKITRVGSTLTYYAKRLADAGWTTLNTATVATTEATFTFGASTTGSGQFVTSNWDNFVVVPEPASLALLGLGALGLLRRRR